MLRIVKCLDQNHCVSQAMGKLKAGRKVDGSAYLRPFKTHFRSGLTATPRHADAAFAPMAWRGTSSHKHPQFYNHKVFRGHTF